MFTIYVISLASSCILAQMVNLIVFLYFLHLPILYCTGSLVVLDVSATVVPSSCRSGMVVTPNSEPKFCVFMV